MAGLVPLFVSTIAEVQQRLRLTGTAEGTDAYAMIEEAVRTVRAGFYRKISVERIAEIAAFTSEMNPITENGVIRQLAEVTEVKWIRYELMRTMPVLFSDSVATVQDAWNAEGMLRGTKPDEREYEMRRLWADIEQAMSPLRGDEEIPKETAANTSVYVSETNPPVAPRASVFGSGGGFMGW